MDSQSRDRRIGRLFDTAATAYARARPGYPPELFDLLETECDLGPGSAVLEIGAGSGQATSVLLEKSARVTAVEPGEAFAAHLLSFDKSESLQVIASSFEDASLPDIQFDLVVSATAFHWVDPAIGVPKVSHALRDEGSFCVWATIFGDPDRADPFHDALQLLLEKNAPELIGPVAQTAPRGTSEWIEVVERSGDFKPLRSQVIRWIGQHDAREISELFSTFSPWLALPQARRDALVAQIEELARTRFSNRVTRPYRTVAHWTRRLSRKNRT